jgi:hypothetical protein
LNNLSSSRAFEGVQFDPTELSTDKQIGQGRILNLKIITTWEQVADDYENIYEDML